MSAQLETEIPEQIAAALDTLVRMSGVSKKAIVADALRGHLVAHGVLPPSTPQIAPSPTRGRLAVRKLHRKEPS